MLTTNDTALVIVDVQGKLAQIMDNKETLFKSLETVIKGAKILDIPIIWVEQIPHKLGPTIPQVSDHLHDHTPIAKNSFSCYREPKFIEALAASGCKNVVVVGIEAHICVYQTVRQLLEADYHVEVVADAVSSRNPTNKQVALQKMQQFGASLTTAEMLIFELQEIAEGERFREILSVVK